MINHGHTIETNLPTKNNIIPEQMTLSLISKHRTIIPQKTRREWYRLKPHPNLSDNEDETEEHKKGHHITTTPPGVHPSTQLDTPKTKHNYQTNDQHNEKSNTNTMSEVEVAGTNTDLVQDGLTPLPSQPPPPPLPTTTKPPPYTVVWKRVWPNDRTILPSNLRGRSTPHDPHRLRGSSLDRFGIVVRWFVGRFSLLYFGV
jgi:hypothetical protein